MDNRYIYTNYYMLTVVFYAVYVFYSIDVAMEGLNLNSINGVNYRYFAFADTGGNTIPDNNIFRGQIFVPSGETIENYLQQALENYITQESLEEQLNNYPTWDDLDSTIGDYLPLSGGTMTGGVTFVGNQSSAWNDKGILFTNGSRIGENSSKALGLYSASTFYIQPDSGTTSSGKGLEISSTAMIPSVNNEMDLGSSSKKYKTVYATTFNGNLAWSNITSKPTTLSGYGITDAKINNGTITLGNNSITPLTSHQSLAGYIPKSTLSGAFDIMYSSSANTPARLGANTTTTKKFLSMTGTGSAGAAPVWDTIDDKTDITVLPNDIGQIKTKFRLNNRGNTGNKATAWYYKLCTLPVNNGSNSASLIFSGRLGGYTSGGMSYIQGMAWNRGTPGIAVFDIGGTAAAMARIFEICDIVGYVNGDSINAQATLTIYILCHGYFTYDLDLELYHSSSTFNYDGTYITTVPTGTLAFQASTSNKRVEMINNRLLVNGTEVVINTGSWDITARNVSKKLTIGSYEYDGNTAVTIPIYDGTYN